jgi:hypothetical protein
VLGRKTILKSDHFPGCQNKRLLPHVEGAPNYRQIDVDIYSNIGSAVRFRLQQEYNDAFLPTFESPSHFYQCTIVVYICPT